MDAQRFLLDNESNQMLQILRGRIIVQLFFIIFVIHIQTAQKQKSEKHPWIKRGISFPQIAGRSNTK